jgi:hydrogenase 3 maturation protease
MPVLADILKRSANLLFIGVGNVLKSDDGAGVVISRRIRERAGIRSLPVEVSIENYIGKINSMEPGEMVILDAMELNAKPGTYRILSLDMVEDATSTTHNISLGKLKGFFSFPTHVLGIQPLNLEIGDRLSPPVQKTVNRIIEQINQLIT